MSFDPDTDMMYFAVGNPAPDFYDEDRKGKNPYTDSIVALDSKTGKFKWASSEVHHDVWDYDAAATPMVLNTKVGGKNRRLWWKAERMGNGMHGMPKPEKPFMMVYHLSKFNIQHHQAIRVK